MSIFITVAIIFLVLMIVYQIAQASEYAAALRATEKERQKKTNYIMASLLVAFFFFGLYAIWQCHFSLLDRMLPKSASLQGEAYDMMFKVTLITTGIVFFITHALLFWFAFKYKATDDRKTSFFFAHNNKLELIWTTVPAIVMAVLVAIGLRNWMTVTSPAPADAHVIEIVGKQFNWIVRYPGTDKVLGKRNYRDINDATNVLGIDQKDPASKDDIVAQNGEMHLVVGKPVKLIIGSRDVIHDVGLPHFRLKMDAVPGITTTLWFTPTITSAEMKEITKNPNFVYEISCDQMCGKGHYSMRGTIIVETQAEYDKWLASQAPYFAPAAPAAAPAADSAAAATPAVAVK
ncbi:MAG: cytochrome c oxidase subunit II [Chitinophagaceae bacterium]|nr:cytochrome c oxidase subunit II [Chitinophagaceae bacterium]